MDMSDERDMRDLEMRLSRSLHAAAPRPAPDLADRCLRRTAVAPQHQRFMGLGLGSLLAAAATVIVAAAVGLGIGTLLSGGVDVGDVVPSQSPSRSFEGTPQPSPPAASPSPSASAAPDALSCENDSIGFRVEYPTDWWANEEEVPEDNAFDPIPECLYFSEEPFDLIPNAGLPSGVAITFREADQPLGEPTTYEVIATAETTIDGRPAVIEEIEMNERAAPFFEAGDRAYSYRIELPDGRTLEAATDTRAGDYEAHKEVLDRMMGSLTLVER